MTQDASVSESLLPSVPGSLLGRDSDHQRHQLGMLPFGFAHDHYGGAEQSSVELVILMM